MKTITYFYMTGCPYCRNADKAMQALISENPSYADIPVERIDENVQSDIADRYDYYHVPTLFIGEEKCYEASPSENYEDIKANVKRVFDLAS